MKSNLSKEREGELFTFLGMFLWGMFPIITVLSFKSIQPMVSLLMSTIFAALFFAIVITIQKKWHEARKIHVYRDIAIATSFVVFFYVLHYTALQYTSPGNSSIVALTEAFFSFLFFNIWRKEHILKEHIAGALLMIVGACIVLFPNTKELNIGDAFILLAAATIPIGNFFQRKTRTQMSSESIMFLRSVFASMLIFIIILLFGIEISFGEIKQSLVFLIINGVFVLGLAKVFWLEAIHRINIAKAVALNATTPVVTLLLAWIFLHTIPTIWQLISFVPIFFGVALLGRTVEARSSS